MFEDIQAIKEALLGKRDYNEEMQRLYDSPEFNSLSKSQQLT
jgi:hypothetical protein